MIPLNEYLDSKSEIKASPSRGRKQKNPDQVWVAIEDEYKGDPYYSYDKDRTSYRVVTLETYNDLKSGKKEVHGRHTYTEIGRSKNKEEAEAMLPQSTKTARKSPINKGDADYIVYAISVGKMNPSGVTKWDWNFWDEWKDSELYIGGEYGWHSFLCGAKGSLKVGDTVYCVDNDSQKALTNAPKKIVGACDCDPEEFKKEFRRLFQNQCKKPSFSFGRHTDGLPWQKMGQLYSIKGVSE